MFQLKICFAIEKNTHIHPMTDHKRDVGNIYKSLNAYRKWTGTSLSRWFLFSKNWITSNNTQKVTTVHTAHGGIPVCRLLLLTLCLHWIWASSAFFFLLLPKWNKFLPSWDFSRALLSQRLSGLSFFTGLCSLGCKLSKIPGKQVTPLVNLPNYQKVEPAVSGIFI